MAKAFSSPPAELVVVARSSYPRQEAPDSESCASFCHAKFSWMSLPQGSICLRRSGGGVWISMSGRFSNVNAILIVGRSGNEKVYHQHHIPCKIETTLYARREKKQNIVLIGNPGTGKTYLSIALGLITWIPASPIGLSLPLSLIAQLRAESGKQIQYQW